MKSAARSFTEPPGLRYSALPRISQPVSSEALRSRISGVLPTASAKPACTSMAISSRGFAGTYVSGPANPLQIQEKSGESAER
jgi:hypothetical protein